MTHLLASFGWRGERLNDTADWIGRTLSKVEIRARLGVGGMAEVYLGHHTTLNHPVAVKILHGRLTEDEAFFNRFRAEAQAVAGLRHPNIAGPGF
jgi:serine/threonine protein kinase